MAAKLCNVCNIRRVYTGSKGTEVAAHGSEMCNYCFEEGGMENQHSDHNHDAILAEVEDNGGSTADLSKYDKAEYESFMPRCWICHPELNLAQRGKKHQDQHSVAGFTRRPQLNHKGHSHPQTPAARRACKKAFWAVRAAQGITTNNVEAKHFAAWDYNCDGNGKEVKPVEQVKAGSGWAGVQPKAANGKVDMQAVGRKVKALSK